MKRHAWIMPEKRDERFTKALFKEVALFVRQFGINNFELEIKEQYTDETSPHYHCHVSCDGRLILSPTQMSVAYVATRTDKKTKGKEMREGEMKLIFKAKNGDTDTRLVIIVAIFYLYDQLIRKYYPEWKTRYTEVRPPR